MIVPASFVAQAVIAQAGPAASAFDLVIVTDETAVSERDAAWMSQRGILHRVVDFTYLRTIFDRAGRITTATLVKLVLSYIFADEYDRILYLDADLTIHADLAPLLELDLGGNAIAANPRGIVFRTQADRHAAEAHFRALGMSTPARYFNSGVMLIDVARWNDQDLTRRTLDYISLNRELCRLPDEDGLNAMLNGQFAALSPAWNMLPRRPPFMATHALVEAAIVHYSGRDKPWKRFGSGKPLFPDMQAYRLYHSFIAGSPWPAWLRRQWTLRDLRDAIGWQLREPWHDRPSASEREEARAYDTSMAAYVAEAEFADIQQGLAYREGGRIRIRRK